MINQILDVPDKIENWVAMPKYNLEPKRGKSTIIIGNSNNGGVDIQIEVSTKFNWFQKKMWKHLLNIDIEDIKEEK